MLWFLGLGGREGRCDMLWFLELGGRGERVSHVAVSEVWRDWGKVSHVTFCVLFFLFCWGGEGKGFNVWLFGGGGGGREAVDQVTVRGVWGRREKRSHVKALMVSTSGPV